MSTQSYVSPWVYPVIAASNRLFLRGYFGSIEIEGKANLPLQGPAVLAVKHYSRWDPLVIALLEWRAMRFMANANQFEGFQGWLLARIGAFAVNLARPQKSSIQHMIDLLHQGEKVVIFPEGGIVRDQLLRSLKPGLSRLILQAESSAAQPIHIPIVPIALHYDPGAHLGATVYLDIAPSFSSQDFVADSDKQRAALMTEYLEQVLRDRLQALHGRSPQPSVSEGLP